MKSQHILKLYCQYISFQKNLQKILGKGNRLYELSRNIFAFKDSTATHWLVALINKKSSLSQSQGQKRKRERERKISRLVLLRRLIKVNNLKIKSLIKSFFYIAGTLDSNRDMGFLGCFASIIFWFLCVLFFVFVCF